MGLGKEHRARLEKLATTNLSDACDKIGVRGAALHILPIHGKKIIGSAVTIKMTAAGLTPSKHHLGIEAIDFAEAGDVIVVDNGGKIDASCWGGILAAAAKQKGISGVVVDGAVRDADEYPEIDFPVWAKTALPVTARGRIMQDSWNVMVQLAGVQVRPGDVIVGDASGIVVIPQEKLDEVLMEAEKILAKEEAMIKEILAGKSILEVDNKFSYEKMLKKDS
ncbi:MAG: dimethylmenaquinone methyltransferase [Firmicutes bacterium HGW-Firmicutes-14]|nr:MAG: dimethylmenaquinone methyltransferase [Firmicutes bacterium HGW-Firmicutes-14]